MKKIALGLTPTFLGGLIYLVYRNDSLEMFNWFEQINLGSFVNFLRTNEFLQNLSLPAWVKYSLPNALWLFSFTYLLLLIWNFKINKQSILWVFIAPVIGVAFEVGQFFKLVSGTFDINDLFLLTLAAILPFSLMLNLKTTKYK